MNRILYPTIFAVGLLAIAWVGAGYIPGNPLALSLVLLIGAFFLMGALELHHYQQATASLLRTLGTVSYTHLDFAANAIARQDGNRVAGARVHRALTSARRGSARTAPPVRVGPFRGGPGSRASRLRHRRR